MAHIKSTLTENSAWCGELCKNEFYFKDAEHAIVSGKTQGDVSICKNCALEIISNLKLDVDPDAVFTRDTLLELLTALFKMMFKYPELNDNNIDFLKTRIINNLFKIHENTNEK